jgi:hypothetical protein
MESAEWRTVHMQHATVLTFGSGLWRKIDPLPTNYANNVHLKSKRSSSMFWEEETLVWWIATKSYKTY